jgi:urea transport system permease protein
MSEATLVTLLNLVYQVAVLSLIVLGLGIVFGLLGIMNMAHGEFVMLGAYAVVVAHRLGLPLWGGIALAVVVTAALGWAVDLLLIRRLTGRPFDTFLATWGLSALLRAAVEWGFGKGYQNVDYATSGMSSLLGVNYPTYRWLLIGAVVAGQAALAAWYLRSPAGARLQAMVRNPQLAEAVGLNTRAMASAAFVAGTAAAGLAGAALAPLVRIEPAMGLDYLLTSFFALVVGGLGSLVGLLAGTGLIAGTQSLVAAFADQTAGYLAVLLVSITFLWLRPHGIVGKP